MLCEAAHLYISRSEMLHIADAPQCRERTEVAVYLQTKTSLMKGNV
jgi:hypothetical protein